MHDSFTPLGGMVPLSNIMLGEVVFGGVGSGMYGMLVFVVLAVFIAGLMVGRTPEYLGKKIEAYDVKMAMLYALIFPLIILTFAAIFVLIPAGTSVTSNPGPHGFTEILYSFVSGAGNNGSAFAGLGTNWWYNIAMGWDMLIGRFLMMIPALALAGKPGAEEERSTVVRHFPSEYAAVRRAAGRHGRDRRRAHLLPGVEPGTDPGTPAVARQSSGSFSNHQRHCIRTRQNGLSWLRKRVFGTRRSLPRRAWISFASSTHAGW